MACAAEDERCFERQVPLDPVGLLRATTASVSKVIRRSKGSLPGASDLPEQAAGLILGLKPRGRSMDAFTTKLVKTLAGFRVDDLFSREEQIELYLSLCPFGSLKGHEVIGLAAAAEVFYSKPHEELSVAQLAELLARLKNPNFFFPYAKQGETDEQYRIRLTRHEARFRGILDAAVRKHWITADEYSQARDQFLAGLAPVDGALENLLVPHAGLLIDAVRNRASNSDQMHLVAETDLDDGVQRILDTAAQTTARELQLRMSSRGHGGDGSKSTQSSYLPRVASSLRVDW